MNGGSKTVLRGAGAVDMNARRQNLAECGCGMADEIGEAYERDYQR